MVLPSAPLGSQQLVEEEPYQFPSLFWGRLSVKPRPYSPIAPISTTLNREGNALRVRGVRRRALKFRTLGFQG